MSDARLERAQHHWAVFAVRKHPRHRGELDGIPEHCAGSVTLDVVDGLGLDAGEAHRVRDHRGLPVHAGSGVAGARAAVVVDGRTEDQSIDVVTVGDRIGKPLQNDDGHAAAYHAAPRAGVERAHLPVRRVDAAFLVHVAGAVRLQDVCAAGDGVLALVVEQGLHREVDRHK